LAALAARLSAGKPAPTTQRAAETVGAALAALAARLSAGKLAPTT